MIARNTILLTFGLAALGSLASACAAQDTPLPQHVDDTPDAESRASMVAVVEAPQHATQEGRPAEGRLAAPDSDCPGFRSGDIDEKTRRGRLAFLRSRAAVMDAGDPALPESLLWMAELSLLGGEAASACEALDRLTAEATEGEWLEAGMCWHEHHCVAGAKVQCPDGYDQDDRRGCQPQAECALDTDGDIPAQVEGACERGDAACCPMEGKVHQLFALRAERAGDDGKLRRERVAMRAHYERACELGHASLCAFVADEFEDAPAAETQALRERACALGHWASCP